MATTMKGLLKGLRYITQIFGKFSTEPKKKKKQEIENLCCVPCVISHSIADEEKEQEMQIGFPTDVKHVAHIGSDGPATSTPSWVRSYKSYVFSNKPIRICTHSNHYLDKNPQMNDFKPQEQHDKGQVVSRGNSNKYNPQG